MAAISFRSKLMRPGVAGGWTFAQLPYSIIKKHGLKPRQRVKGLMDGAEFSSSLIPRGGGTLFLVVNGKLRDQVGKHSGDRVIVSMELDTRPAVPSIPMGLKRALANEPRAREFLNSLPPSQRKAFFVWIESAKKDDTRTLRIQKTIGMLLSRKRFT